MTVPVEAGVNRTACSVDRPRIFKTYSPTQGFALVEVLVALGIVSLTLALVIPAVMSARSAARRAGCASNMRQIGIASGSYVAAFGCFPSCYMPPARLATANGATRVSRRFFSVFSTLLAFQDQVPLYDSINFSVYMDDPYADRHHGDHWPGFASNQTALLTEIGSLLCPADARVSAAGCVSYRVNLGTERWYFSTNGPYMKEFTTCSPNDVTDGMSNTIAFSEKPTGNVAPYGASLESAMFAGARGLPFTLAEVISVCAVPRAAGTAASTSTGLCWMAGTLGQTCYNHTLTPNSPVRDCICWSHNPITGLIAARSFHDAGVNAMAADGSVRFFRSSIDHSVWRALGSRSEGEIITSY